MCAQENTVSVWTKVYGLVGVKVGEIMCEEVVWTTETIDKVLINHIDKDKEYRTRFLSVQETIRVKM